MSCFLKPGVRLRGIRPELSVGLLVAHSVYLSYNVPMVITAVRDGKHMEGSLHYEGAAADLRLPSRYSDHPGLDRAVCGDLQRHLAAEFDVVLESDHIHLEFDDQDSGKTLVDVLASSG